MSDLPRPIPWIGVVGHVPALDAPAQPEVPLRPAPTPITAPAPAEATASAVTRAAPR